MSIQTDFVPYDIPKAIERSRLEGGAPAELLERLSDGTVTSQEVAAAEAAMRAAGEAAQKTPWLVDGKQPQERVAYGAAQFLHMEVYSKYRFDGPLKVALTAAKDALGGSFKALCRCTTCAGKCAGSDWKSGSCAAALVACTSTVPISIATGWSPASPPRAWASSWWP